MNCINITPDLRVLYHLCVGKYTQVQHKYTRGMQSKFMCISVRFSNEFHVYRTPFEMNTTLRCPILSVCKTCNIMCFMIIFSGGISYIFGVIIHTEAILIDIKSLFERIDRLSKVKDAEPSLLE